MDEQNTQIPEFTREEIDKKIEAGDKDMINRVLSKQVKIKQEIPVENSTPEGANTTVNAEPVKPEEPSIDAIIEKETERARQYVKDVELRYSQSEAQLKAEKETLLKQIEDERLRKEELERKLREVSVQPPTILPENGSVAEDEDLASDYAKNTRKMVNDLKETIKSLSSGDPRIKVLEEKIQGYEKIEADRKRVEEQEHAERKRKDAEQKIANEVVSLQQQYPELQTKNSFTQIAEDFTRFRNSLVNMLGATSPQDQDRLLMTYFDESRGAQLREEAKKNGVNPPDDYDKFVQIAELIDMTNGIEYDPILERFVQIKNSFGEPVRYRSIEEAYRVKNYNNEIVNAKKKAFKEVKTKIDQINDSPAKLDNRQTAPIDNAITPDQIQVVLNNAESYVRDPAKYELLVKAYQAIGQPPPAPRFKNKR